jgi:predicted alpha/beta-hydrolase family hydrolase
MTAVEPFPVGELRGVVHRPDGAGDDGLVLTHGAGSDHRAPVLVAVADAFAAAGVTVLRFDLPFRQRRPRGPPSPRTAAADREGLRRAVTALRALVPGRIFLGGHSYGGRQATMLAADDPAVAGGLLLLSYPLHPPNKPDQLRTQHFPRLRVPSVFVHGSDDPFGSVDEMTAAVALIPAPTRLIPIAGARHDLKRGRVDLAPAIAALLGGAAAAPTLPPRPAGRPSRPSPRRT